MEALILAAILNYPVTPLCQQWLDRMNQESRFAARLVWSPQKQRHISRMHEAAAQVQNHCESATTVADAVAVIEPTKR